jgi:hypothetical protein
MRVKLKTKSAVDPIHQDADGRWFFWDETWAARLGPYKTRALAKRSLAAYVEYLETGKSPDGYK